MTSRADGAVPAHRLAPRAGGRAPSQRPVRDGSQALSPGVLTPSSSRARASLHKDRRHRAHTAPCAHRDARQLQGPCFKEGHMPTCWGEELWGDPVSPPQTLLIHQLPDAPCSAIAERDLAHFHSLATLTPQPWGARALSTDEGLSGHAGGSLIGPARGSSSGLRAPEGAASVGRGPHGEAAGQTRPHAAPAGSGPPHRDHVGHPHVCPGPPGPCPPPRRVEATITVQPQLGFLLRLTPSDPRTHLSVCRRPPRLTAAPTEPQGRGQDTCWEGFRQPVPAEGTLYPLARGGPPPGTPARCEGPALPCWAAFFSGNSPQSEACQVMDGGCRGEKCSQQVGWGEALLWG